MTVAALELMIVVAGIVATVAGIMAGGGTIAAVAVLIGGVIATVNAVTNMINEGRALAGYGEDPTRARRISKENSIQDTLRNETNENISVIKVDVRIDIPDIKIDCSGLCSTLSYV